MIYRISDPGFSRPPQGEAPPSIANTLALFWSETGTSTTTDGAGLQTWSDQSGNTNHATQNTAGNQPVYKTGGPGGKPFVRFDGSNDFLNIGGAANYSQATIAFVFKYVANIFPIWSNRHITTPPSGTNWTINSHWNSASTPITCWMTSSNPQNVDGGNLTANAWCSVFYVLTTDTKLELFINNVSVNSNTGINRILSLPNSYIGRDDASYGAIDLAYLQIIGRGINATERGTLQTWFSRFGL